MQLVWDASRRHIGVLHGHGPTLLSVLVYFEISGTQVNKKCKCQESRVLDYNKVLILEHIVASINHKQKS